MNSKIPQKYLTGSWLRGLEGAQGGRDRFQLALKPRLHLRKRRDSTGGNLQKKKKKSLGLLSLCPQLLPLLLQLQEHLDVRGHTWASIRTQ
jgi:hypothetical protein